MRRILLLLAISLVIGVIVLFFMLNAAIGDCPTSTDCISETTRRIMFFGSPVAGLALIVAVGVKLTRGSH